MTDNTTSPSVKLAAIFIGIAIPCLVFGRLIMALPLIGAILLLLWLPERKRFWPALLNHIRTPVGVLVLVTLAFWLPSMAISPFPLRSFEAWLRVPVFIGMAVIFWTMLSEQRDMHALSLKALIVTCAVTTLFALILLTILPPEYTSFFRLKGFNPAIRPPEIMKEYGTVTILLIPVLAWAGWRLAGRWQTLSVVTVLALLAVVWLTQNRSAMAGLLIMLLVCAGLFVCIQRNLTLKILFSVAVIAITAALLLWLHETRGQAYFPSPPEGAVTIVPPWLLDWQRQTIWARSLQFAMDSPWIGNGINVINLLPGAEEKLFTSRLHFIPSHPHSWFFEIFAETGALGVFSLLSLVITLWLKLVGDFLKYRDGALLSAVLVHTGYWASGLLNVSFWSAWWNITYLVMMAICLAGRARLDQE